MDVTGGVLGGCCQVTVARVLSTFTLKFVSVGVPNI